MSRKWWDFYLTVNTEQNWIWIWFVISAGIKFPDGMSLSYIKRVTSISWRMFQLNEQVLLKWRSELLTDWIVEQFVIHDSKLNCLQNIISSKNFDLSIFSNSTKLKPLITLTNILQLYFSSAAPRALEKQNWSLILPAT